MDFIVPLNGSLATKTHEKSWPSWCTNTRKSGWVLNHILKSITCSKGRRGGGDRSSWLYNGGIKPPAPRVFTDQIPCQVFLSDSVMFTLNSDIIIN